MSFHFHLFMLNINCRFYVKYCLVLNHFHLIIVPRRAYVLFYFYYFQPIRISPLNQIKVHFSWPIALGSTGPTLAFSQPNTQQAREAGNQPHSLSRTPLSHHHHPCSPYTPSVKPPSTPLSHALITNSHLCLFA